MSLLLIFAHPAYERSRTNRALVDAVQGLPGLTFHDLYERYPDFEIDVPAEQRRLVEHETIVLQHPLYWYSTPALVKEWFDIVLQHGWAYGSRGTALHGKRLMTATTAGAPEDSYGGEGAHCLPLRDLLAPIEQTARFCGMHYLDPFAVYGTLEFGDAERAAEGERYRRRLQELIDGHR